MATCFTCGLKGRNLVFTALFCISAFGLTTYLGFNGQFQHRRMHFIFREHKPMHHQFGLENPGGNGQKLTLNLEKPPSDLETYRFPAGLSEGMKKSIEKSVRWMTGLKEPPKFLPEYKNPCWYEDFDPLIGKGKIYRDNWYGRFHPYAKKNSNAFKSWEFNLYSWWSQNKKRLRCIPYFYLAGIAKCGTTDLFQRILSHPDVADGLLKMSQWWGRLAYNTAAGNGSGVPFIDFVDLFDYPARVIEKYTCTTCPKLHHQIVGDYSTNTLFDNDYWIRLLGNNPQLHEPNITTAHYIRYFQPGAKILAIFREPTERLYSDYLFFYKGVKSPERFHSLAKQAVELFDNCTKTFSVRSCAYNRTLHSQEALRIVRLRVGLYHVYVNDYLRVFPRDQLLFLRLEDYHNNMNESLNRVYNFLGLRDLNAREEYKVLRKGAVNSRSKNNTKIGDALERTKILLRNFYAKHNDLLAEALGDDGFKWHANEIKQPADNGPEKIAS
ncbi:carbohydrate sulfotransferase 15-like isoform X1 [Lingula anatina]|uniref:Carbohydrate sulfotransferase 15-like isoform X1 n=1 Tax=Lingula anatina TaxID=7574 RepID=A0A1S3K0K9_LINAN|nr:carbohydrate sulfotransferase 15-like isoform X1 [Lingula anatina]|eukprot:XP_013416168.1 carbohydrate sulfotransferase 15-like isoform X1 [Lingula anatina]